MSKHKDIKAIEKAINKGTGGIPWSYASDIISAVRLALKLKEEG